jgi:death on curing protein
MISLTQAEQVHKILVEQFGGTSGIRDIEALASALSRPFQTFEGREFYPTAIQKAASLLESVLSNHPFVDGNKRTGYVLMRLLLISYGFDIKATQEEKYNFVIKIASGKSNFNDIINWLEHFTVKLNAG